MVLLAAGVPALVADSIEELLYYSQWPDPWRREDD